MPRTPRLEKLLAARALLAGLAAMLVIVAAGTPVAHAAGDIVVKSSALSVKETIDTLSAKLQEKGIAIVARVDHAAGAKAAGLDLPPTELLIFGNPKLGTPLMQAGRMIGLDLPMKVLAWQEADGSVKIAYTAPSALIARHGISGQDKVIEAMTKALDGLTSAAGGAGKAP